MRDDGGRYRPGDEFWPEDAYRPADGPAPGGQYVTYGQRTGYPGPGPAPGRPGDLPGARPGAGADRGPGAGPDRGGSPNSGPQPQAPARPYGRIQIFTLLDDRVADFDRLAEEMAERVSAGEPDTLVYVIHLVPNAPMQRIIYEIYRDRAAFDSHENQPYVQRFAAERRSLVLATNVIELRLKYAKVAPLPAPQQAMPAGAPPQPPLPQQPPRTQPGPAAAGRGPQRPPGSPGPHGPQGPQGPVGDPRLQPPPPPGRPQPPPPAGPPRYEPRRPDPRQVPSAGRPYGS